MPAKVTIVMRALPLVALLLVSPGLRSASAQDTPIQDNLAQAVAAAVATPDSPSTAAPANALGARQEGYQWGPALGQSIVFLVAQHGFRLATEEKTRSELNGDFWRDYQKSVRGLRGWDDGGKIFTNYIAHPAQGAVTGYIWVQNDPKARTRPIGFTRGYWGSRMKAMLWTTFWSTQFEIGPISEASIGNVGMTPGTAGYVDLVVTPIMGTALMIVEDASDRYVVSWINRHTHPVISKIITPWLTPTRSVANAMRFRVPWYRDPPVGTTPPGAVQ